MSCLVDITTWYRQLRYSLRLHLVILMQFHGDSDDQTVHYLRTAISYLKVSTRDYSFVYLVNIRSSLNIHGLFMWMQCKAQSTFGNI